MSLTSYRAAPPRVTKRLAAQSGLKKRAGRAGRLGSDLLFRALRRSTIGAEGFHGRVRDGIGCFAPRYGHQASQTAPVMLLGPRLGEKRVCDDRPIVSSFREALPLRCELLLILAAECGTQVRHRAISTGQLHALPRFHLRPINVVV